MVNGLVGEMVIRWMDFWWEDCCVGGLFGGWVVWWGGRLVGGSFGWGVFFLGNCMGSGL